MGMIATFDSNTHFPQRAATIDLAHVCTPYPQVLMDLIGVLVTCLISSALLPVDQKASAIDLVRMQDR